MHQRKEEAPCTKNRRKLLDSAAKQIGEAEIGRPSPEIAGGCLQKVQLSLAGDPT
jgi:hypothetical protein